jgi:hypothetical protein
MRKEPGVTPAAGDTVEDPNAAGTRGYESPICIAAGSDSIEGAR